MRDVYVNIEHWWFSSTAFTMQNLEDGDYKIKMFTGCMTSVLKHLIYYRDAEGINFNWSNTEEYYSKSSLFWHRLLLTAEYLWYLFIRPMAFFMLGKCSELKGYCSVWPLTFLLCLIPLGYAVWNKIVVLCSIIIELFLKWLNSIFKKKMNWLRV